MSRRYTDQYEYWAEAVRMHEEIGGSAAAFCRAEGLTVSQFYQWRIRLRRQAIKANSSGGAAAAAFVPLRFAGEGVDADAGSGVSIEVGGARVVLTRGFDASEMVRAVESMSSKVWRD